MKKTVAHLFLVIMLIFTLGSPAMAEGTNRSSGNGEGNVLRQMDDTRGKSTRAMENHDNFRGIQIRGINNNNDNRGMNGNNMRARAANATNDTNWSWLGWLGLLGLAGLFRGNNRNRNYQ